MKIDKEIYKQNIIDHYKNPRNYGNIKNPTFKNKGINPNCGDIIEISVKLNKDKIEKINFMGHGCAISIASTSMLTEKLKNMNLKKIKNISKNDIVKMLGTRIDLSRERCGTLGLKTLLEGIKKFEIKNE